MGAPLIGENPAMGADDSVVGERGAREVTRASRNDRNGLVDAIRVVAAGLVFIGHAELATGIELDWYTASLGVGMFFVLSGYLIPTVWLRDPSPQYFWRRFARIYPGYLAAVIGLAIVTGHRIDAREVLMLQTFDNASFDSFLGVAWTLQIEVVFYALVPLLVRLSRSWLAVLGFASLIAFAVAPEFRGTFPSRFWMFVPGMLLVGVRLPEVAVPRWVTFGAAISYGVYLWHRDLLRLLRDAEMAPAVVWIGGALLTVLAATVSWYAIERPALRQVRVPHRNARLARRVLPARIVDEHVAEQHAFTGRGG